MMKRAFAMASVLSALGVVGGCSSDKPKPIAPTTTLPDGGQSATDGGVSDAGQAAAAAPDAAPVGTAPVFFTDGGSAPPPVAAVGEAALDGAIDLAITTASPKLAPKMDKEGQPGRATLAEGGHFSMVVTMAPNRCYTIIGFSPPGNVSQLDLKLYAMPLNIEAGKSAAADKAMPVIGKGATTLCPILPVAVPYKLDAVATKGAGRIGIHVFARNK